MRAGTEKWVERILQILIFAVIGVTISVLVALIWHMPNNEQKEDSIEIHIETTVVTSSFKTETTTNTQSTQKTERMTTASTHPIIDTGQNTEETTIAILVSTTATSCLTSTVTTANFTTSPEATVATSDTSNTARVSTTTNAVATSQTASTTTTTASTTTTTASTTTTTTTTTSTTTTTTTTTSTTTTSTTTTSTTTTSTTITTTTTSTSVTTTTTEMSSISISVTESTTTPLTSITASSWTSSMITTVSTSYAIPAPTTATLPEKLQQVVDAEKAKYPGIDIGVGVYSLDGKSGFVYNQDKVISGGCTVKAAYACYVFEVCEAENINIWQTEIEYTTNDNPSDKSGSEFMNSAKVGDKIPVATLIREMLYWSDNRAYNMLVRFFSPKTSTMLRMEKFQRWLDEVGGANLWYSNHKSLYQYGAASVTQRYHEWMYIWNYIHSEKKFASTLEGYLRNTAYCYLINWAAGSHTYLHKSGWSSGSSYTAACDCAIIDDSYLVIVMTQDYKTMTAHADVVKELGKQVVAYVDSVGVEKMFSSFS